MSLTQTQIVDAAEVLLTDKTNLIWAVADLNSILQTVVLPEVERKEAKFNKTPLAITQYTNNIDISGLTYRTKILRVEWPPDYAHPSLVNWEYWNEDSNIIKLDIASEPSITTGTLTGTITFTQSSRSISGVGTAFGTELAENDYICVSTATKLYRVAHITSATALTLEIAFAETGGADVLDSTIYYRRSSVANVYWESKYTIGASSTDAPDWLDKVLVFGVVAYALSSITSEKINQVNIGEQAAARYMAQGDRWMSMYNKELETLGRIDDDVSYWHPKGSASPSQYNVWNMG